MRKIRSIMTKVSLHLLEVKLNTTLIMVQLKKHLKFLSHRNKIIKVNKRTQKIRFQKRLRLGKEVQTKFSKQIEMK